MNNLKDKLTDVIAVVAVVVTAVNAYLQANTGDIDWMQLGMGVFVAVTSYFTGKKADGGTKKIV